MVSSTIVKYPGYFHNIMTINIYRQITRIASFFRNITETILANNYDYTTILLTYYFLNVNPLIIL